MTAFRLCAVVCAMMAFSVAAPAAPALKTVHVRYPLRARTEAGLLAEMRLRGPLVEGRRAFARNTMKANVTTTMKPRPGGGGCAVRDVRMRITFTIFLPKALNAARLSAPARRRWRAFLRHLERHELRHRAIWLQCARRAEKRMKRLQAPSCGRLRARVRSVYEKTMAECDRRHDAFDKREKGAVLRIPFVRAALRTGKKRRRARR